MKHKICKGKIYVTTMPILGVLKHFVEDFKLQFIEKTGINIKALRALDFEHQCFLDAFLLNFHMIWSMMFLVIVLFTVSTRPCALSVLRTALSWPSKS